MTQYTTVANVSNELNGYTLNSSTTPTSTIVSGWIDDATAEVDLMTGQVWSSTVASSEIHDYDGGGFLRTYYAPIISVTELLAESNGIGATTEGWQTLSEGRTSTKDFLVYNDEGEISFHGTQKPTAGYQNMSISYTYGYATVPTAITQLATMLVSKRVIDTIISGSATNEGGRVSVGTISVGDPSNFGIGRVSSINTEINDLLKEIGILKVYRNTDRRY